MRRASWVVVGLLLVAGLAVGPGCKKQVGKPLSLKILLPHEETKVLVDGKRMDGSGTERTIETTTELDTDHFVITAIWQPNNYTTITRERKLAWKDGLIEVDLRKPSDTEKDDIKVRYVPTPQDFVEEMCKMARVGKDDVVYDLGCGDGRLVVTAVKQFGAKRGVGVDIDPDRVKEAKAKAEEAGVADKVEFRVGDVLKVADLSDASVVLLYMGDDINQRLKPILKSTLKPGSRVVSHRFLMGADWPPDKSVERTSTDKSSSLFSNYTQQLHLWEIK
jgi:SAM-dependent methyltransferase